LHELSLAGEVLKIAEDEVRKNKASLVSEITIEAGDFCGVEIDAFRSALEILSEGSFLSTAALNIVRIKGRGYCHTCDIEFDMESRVDTCPGCNSFASEIRNGHEFRVVSLVVEKDEKEV
jgi:hydrogenase nickel incorporation protein HypA/HybF